MVEEGEGGCSNHYTATHDIDLLLCQNPLLDASGIPSTEEHDGTYEDICRENMCLDAHDEKLT